MSKSNEINNRQQKNDSDALKLMSYVCQSPNNDHLKKELNILGYELIPDYSVRNVGFPKYCGVAIRNIKDSSEIYVLNRGISRFHFNWFGFLEELQDVVDITRNQVVQGAGELQEVINKINRDFDVNKLTLVGHSRGALAAIYNANIPELDPLTHPNIRIIAVDSPGVNNFEVKNTNFIEYKAIPNFLNCWGGLVSNNTFLIEPKQIRYHDMTYVEYSNFYHDIDLILENLDNCKSLNGWYTTKTAYNNFLAAGGKKDWLSYYLVEGGNFLSYCHPGLASLIKNISYYIDPNSYQASIEQNLQGYSLYASYSESTELTVGGGIENLETFI